MGFSRVIGSMWGQSVNIENRWYAHKSDLKQNKHHCQFLQRAYNQHGLDSLEFLILETCQEDLLDQLESYWWDLKNSGGFQMFNSRPEGGVLRGQSHGSYGKTHSEESKRRLSQALKGRPKTEETKRRMSLVQKGKTRSEETKHRMSLARKGTTRSEETKHRMREARSVYSYKILQKDTGLIFEVDSLTKFCQDNGISQGNLSMAFNRKIYKQSRGYYPLERTNLATGEVEYYEI